MLTLYTVRKKIFLGAFLYKYFYYVTESPSVSEAKKLFKFMCYNAILRYYEYRPPTELLRKSRKEKVGTEICVRY